MALSPLSPSRLNTESISNWFNAPSSSLTPSKSINSNNKTAAMSLSPTAISDTNNNNNNATINTPKYDHHSNRSRSSSKNVKDSLSSWRESSSSPFLDEIDQENVAPASAPSPSFETPTRHRKRSTGLKESSCSPLATPAVTDATADVPSTVTASVQISRSARRRPYNSQEVDHDDYKSNIQILSDETRTTDSPKKRIADVMLRSVDVSPSGCRTPTADPTLSPRTTTTKKGIRSGNGGGDDCTSGNVAAASGLFPGSAIKHGKIGELLVSSDGSPSKNSPRSGNQAIHNDSNSPGPQDDSTITTDEQANIDDTCFTAFSEIPNAEVTQYTKVPSGIKQMAEDHNATPRNRRPRSPLAHSPSPSPFRHAIHSANDPDMTNLLDFTQQMESFSNASRKSPSKFKPTSSPMKFQSQPNLLSFINNQRSPAKASGMSSTPAERQSILNLLDFELPPAPTPRSIPTVTARELESLKSQYLSEISSLKATLSGKCAEVDSLKKAVTDAERRVGQAQEELREECSAKEHAERERTVWEKKGKEVEEILQAIRKEVMSNEKEMSQLESRLQESEQRAEDAEAREADAKTAAAEAERKAANLAAAASASADSTTGPEQAASADYIAKQVQKELDEKIGGISSELHAVYKKKHETKVATLKKSYEARAEKKCAELQKRIADLSKQNEELQLSKDATFSGVLPKDIPNASSPQTDVKLLEEQKVEIEQQRAKLVGMMTELESVKGQQAHLLRELENERAEKGELVAAAEEMLGLQHDSASAGAGAGVDDFRKSISRCSGLRPPAASSSASSSLESRIGRVGGNSGSGGATGLARPVAGLKSKMMSNIERMGGGSGGM